MKMFDIGLNNHAATSLCVRVKELPSVTETLAANMDMPEVSEAVEHIITSSLPQTEKQCLR